MRFKFLRDKDTYSWKELICNWVIMFGWVVGLIIAIITGGCAWKYLSNTDITVYVPIPDYFQPLMCVAFIFMVSSLFAAIFKIKFKKQRKNGTLPSINDYKRKFIS